MGKHKKNKAKENKDKKTERKPIKRVATGHKYVLHTHTVINEHTKNGISRGLKTDKLNAHLVTQLYKK